MLSNWAFFNPGLATTTTTALLGPPWGRQHQLADPWDTLWDAMADQGSTTNLALG